MVHALPASIHELHGRTASPCQTVRGHSLTTSIFCPLPDILDHDVWRSHTGTEAEHQDARLVAHPPPGPRFRLPMLRTVPGLGTGCDGDRNSPCKPRQRLDEEALLGQHRADGHVTHVDQDHHVVQGLDVGQEVLQHRGHPALGIAAAQQGPQSWWRHIAAGSVS